VPTAQAPDRSAREQGPREFVRRTRTCYARCSSPTPSARAPVRSRWTRRSPSPYSQKIKCPRTRAQRCSSRLRTFPRRPSGTRRSARSPSGT
ncbi:hypothetical protein BC834DRAFT_954884, partial [Gloeopeniophorella convolvens]